MKILAFDCTAGGCSASVWVDGHRLAGESEALDRGQAAALMPMISRVLAAASLDTNDIDRIATTVGPGSFTGLRIGLAAAIGLELATGAPIHGVNSFDALAHRLGGSTDTGGEETDILAIESKRADLYVRAPGLFEEDGCRHPEEVAEAWRREKASAALHLAGDGAERVAAVCSAQGLPVAGVHGLTVDADDIAAVAMADLATGRDGLPARPLYLRPPDVTPPRAGAAGIA